MRANVFCKTRNLLACPAPVQRLSCLSKTYWSEFTSSS